MFGESMPPSWKGKYAPGKNSPPRLREHQQSSSDTEDIMNEVIETRLSRILRRITGSLMAAADLNTIRSTIEGRLATELAGSLSSRGLSQHGL